MVQPAAGCADVGGKGFGRIFDALLFREHGAHGAEVAGGDGRVAAEIAHLFDDDHVFAAVLSGGKCGAHARQPRTDDNDVKHFIPLRFLLFGRGVGHASHMRQRHAYRAPGQKGTTRQIPFCHRFSLLQEVPFLRIFSHGTGSSLQKTAEVNFYAAFIFS